MKLLMRQKNACFVTLGLILTLLGVLSLTCFSSLYNFIVKKLLAMDPESEAYKKWYDGRPLTLEIYMFNWTNPHEIEDPNSKPRFEQLGPYKFIQTRDRINVAWNHHNDTITYQNAKYYYFDGDSPRSLDDTITSINAVSLVSNNLSVSSFS